MKAHIYLMCLFVVLLITPSCLTVVKFQVKHPPELKLAKENSRFVYINTYDLAELNLSDEKKITVYNSGIKNVQLGLEETFLEDTKIEFVVCNSAIKQKADSLFQSSTNPDYTKFICDEYEATHLLELDSFDMFFNSHIIEDSEDDMDDEDGSKEIKFRSFTVTVEVDFKLFSKDGKLFNRSTIKKSKHHKSRPILIQWIELTPSVKKAGKNVNLLSKSIGINYRGRFYPNLENVSRDYYGGKDFKEIRPLIENKEWHKAKDALLLMIESNDSSISQKQVAHNLYVVYKALGDNKASNYWLIKSGNRLFMAQEGF
jgi:hypothetical protein